MGLISTYTPPFVRDVGSAYRLRVLVANSPQSYREAISEAISMLRPQVQVSTANAEDLDRAVRQLTPHLVVCSRITEAVAGSARAWVELYPEGGPGAAFGHDKHRTALPEASLEDLLDIIDRLE